MFRRFFFLQNLILRTRSCVTGFITQSGWVFHFHQTTLFWWKWFVPQLYQFRRGISGGPALKYFYMIHRGGRWVVFKRPREFSHGGIQFTKRFIEFVFVETNEMVCSNSNVILTRQTCGHRSSRVAGSKRRARAFCFSVRIWYMFLMSKCRVLGTVRPHSLCK